MIEIRVISKLVKKTYGINDVNVIESSRENHCLIELLIQYMKHGILKKKKIPWSFNWKSHIMNDALNHVKRKYIYVYIKMAYICLIKYCLHGYIWPREVCPVKHIFNFLSILIMNLKFSSLKNMNSFVKKLEMALACDFSN